MEAEREVGSQLPGLDPELGSRIERIVGMIGTDVEAAEVAGISVDTLANYEKLRTPPKLEPLVLLAAKAGVSIAWLITGQGEIRPAKVHPRGVSDGEDSEFVALPRYNVEASAGAGNMIETEHVVDYLYFRRDWLRRKLGVNPARLVLLEAAGDSMAETIKNGDLMIVDASEPRFHGDGIYVFSVDDALMVKRVGMRLAGGVRISSDNPRYPETLEIARDDVERRMRFVGKVVWKGGEL